MLTAAHCLFEDNGQTIKKNSLSLVIGARDISQGKQVFAAREFIPHPDFDNKRLKNDIALIRLSAPAPGRMVSPALARKEYTSGVSGGWPTVRFAGYGVTCLEYQTEPSCYNGKLLNQGRGNLVDKSLCQLVEAPINLERPLLCVLPKKTPDGRQPRICFGDSGGPLVLNRGGRPMLIGVLSYSNIAEGQECSPRLPSAYFSLAKYHRWMSHHINQRLTISAGPMQMSGVEDLDQRQTTVKIRNLSRRWSLTLKDLRLEGISRHCVDKKWIKSHKKSKLGVCGIASRYSWNSSSPDPRYERRWTYNSRHQSWPIRKESFQITAGNCPFLRPGVNISNWHFKVIVAAQSFPMLGPGKSCSMKIKFSNPDNAWFPYQKDKLVNAPFGSAPAPGAQALGVFINQGWPHHYAASSRRALLLKSCIEQTSRGLSQGIKWPLSSCANSWKEIRAHSVGKFYLSNCLRTMNKFNTGYAPKCQELLPGGVALSRTDGPSQ